MSILAAPIHISTTFNQYLHDFPRTNPGGIYEHRVSDNIPPIRIVSTVEQVFYFIKQGIDYQWNRNLG